MNKINAIGRVFTLRPTVFALLMASAGSVFAGSTPATAPIIGRAPVLVAPSNGALSAVDFSGTFAVAEQLSTGDTIVMTYSFNDPDGDADHSDSTVVWRYVKQDGTLSEPLTAKSIPASATGQGTSTLIIPADAIGAKAIWVELDEMSVTGNPRKGNRITVKDTSLTSDEGGKGSVTPPGPILAGGNANVVGGIFLASDNPSAGSGATDYTKGDVKPLVGQTYVFKAWRDLNQNGVWDADDIDVTASLNSIQWILDGSNATAAAHSGTTTLVNQPISGAVTPTYTVPVNADSRSGGAAGDQGFNLKVEFK